MATLGVLGSLMSQLGSTQLPQYDPQQVALAQQRLQSGRMGNETALLQLDDLRRQQEAQAQARQYYQEHPEALLGQQGQPMPTLGTLTAPVGPPGAITQQPFGPGGAVGPTQTIPAPMAPNANLGGPPGGLPGAPLDTTRPGQAQSTLASLTPQAQGPSPQDRLLALARTNPDAAALIQQRMQGQQDLALKRQEQHLTMGTKVMEYLGRGAQGVTDQASLDAFRQEVRQVHPQAAAQLPQVYSKEALAPFIAKALDVKDAMTLQVQDLQAQAAVIKARREGRSTDVDNQLIAMGVQPGQETPQQMREALQAVEASKVRVSASHGTGQVFDTPEGKMRLRPGTNTVEPLYTPGGQQLQPKPTQAEQETATFSNLARQGHTGAVELEQKGFTPGFWAKSAEKLPLHIGNYLTSDEHQKYKDYVMDFAQAWLRRTSKGAITETEWKFVDERYFPQPGNSKAQIEQKRQARENVIKELEAEGKGTGRTGTQGQSTIQPPLKPVGEMSREELLAERDRLRKGGR